jgi:hypothetical protein
MIERGEKLLQKNKDDRTRKEATAKINLKMIELGEKLLLQKK